MLWLMHIATETEIWGMDFALSFRIALVNILSISCPSPASHSHIHSLGAPLLSWLKRLPGPPPISKTTRFLRGKTTLYYDRPFGRNAREKLSTTSSGSGASAVVMWIGKPRRSNDFFKPRSLEGITGMGLFHWVGNDGHLWYGFVVKLVVDFDQCLNNSLL